MKNFYRYLAVAACGVVCSDAFAADGIAIQPGKWELTMTVNAPMMPQDQVKTSVECINQDRISAKDMLQDQDACQIVDSSVEGDTLKWRMECPGPTGNAMAEGFYTSQGDSMNGEMRMTMSMNGQTMTMNNTWNGRRIGDCD